MRSSSSTEVGRSDGWSRAREHQCRTAASDGEDGEHVPVVVSAEDALRLEWYRGIVEVEGENAVSVFCFGTHDHHLEVC